MRRGHGSTKVPNVKLKPAKKGTNLPKDIDNDVAMYDVGGGSARETLRNDAKPFTGMTVCCSGVKDKAALLAKARELGATCSSDLTDLTTHLVADAPGSAKYKVAVELEIPICTSDWIIQTHKRWLAGEDIDPDEAVSDHLLPPLRGVVVCVTRLTDNDARQRITKSATRLGAKYQAHMDKAATHLLIGPDDAAAVDSQKLQWVMRTNAKRLEEQSEEPPIHVVWDLWLLTCAATNSRVSESDFAYSEGGVRPEPPEDLERMLRRASAKKPARVYVTASNVGASTNTRTKEVLEKARVKRVAPTGAVWNSILSSRSQAPREEDEIVPPTPMQARDIPRSTPPTSTPPMPTKLLSAAAGDDSATEDEEESMNDRNAIPTSAHMGQKQAVVDPPIPSNRGTAAAKVQSGAGGLSMVSRLNSLRGSAFQLGAGVSDQDLPSSSIRGLARATSNATLGQKLRPSDAVEPSEAGAAPPSTAKVFTGKRIAPIGEARGPMLYAALRAHGAIVVESSEASDPKGKGKAVESDGMITLPQEEVDYYIVRLASESAKHASKHDSYPKFRTDCWVEHCIFEDRLCAPEENVTYAPLSIQVPVPEADTIKLHWTGLNNEQETAVKRLTKAIGMPITESFAKRVNTHLLCPSRSGLKYEKAVHWKISVVDMDWLYGIAKEGRIPDADIVHARQKLDQSTSGGDTTTELGIGTTSLFGLPNGLLAPHSPAPEPAPRPGPIAVDPVGNNTPTSNTFLGLKREGSSSIFDTRVEDSTTELKNRTIFDTEVDREREREAQRNQLANSLDALLKKHQREESMHSDQPRKRIRPTMRHKAAEGATAGSMSRSRSLTEKVSSLSLSTRVSDPDYVSPLEGIEPANEETLQVHYHDPDQLAAKEGLRRLLDGSSQVVDPDIINIDTQTEPEESPDPVSVEPRRKRGGGAGGRRKSQRRP